MTQTTFGLSRDDAGRFLGEYTEKGIIQHDPFVTLDPGGVGELMWIAPWSAGAGQHADQEDRHLRRAWRRSEDTIKFCEDINLDYVSCSPYRVTVAARSAQARLRLDAKPR